MCIVIYIISVIIRLDYYHCGACYLSCYPRLKKLVNFTSFYKRIAFVNLPINKFVFP